jgi:hypothetical protein
VKTALGDHAGGLAALNEAHAMAKELARQAPQDFRLQRGVWLTEYLICELLIDKADGGEAVPACEKTIAFPEAAPGTRARERSRGLRSGELPLQHVSSVPAGRRAGSINRPCTTRD